MIQLIGLEIDNFLCFGEGITIDLHNRGLVCITGQNRDSSASNSNGAGKSSIFESIYYAIYGKILRPGRIRMEHTIRRGAKGSLVRLTYRDATDRMLRIRRYRKDKVHGDSLYFEDISNSEVVSLGGQDKDATQKIIIENVGMSDSLFRQIVLFGEGGMPRFSELSDSEKKKLIEEILGLHIYERAGKLARERLGGCLDRKTREKHELDGVNEHLVTAKKRQKDLEDSIRVWDEERQKELEHLSSEMSRLQKIKSEIDSVDPKNWVQSKEQKEGELAEIRQELQGIHHRERRINQGYIQKREELTKKEGELEARKKYLDEEYKQIDGLIFDGICPTCKQPTDNLDRGRMGRINDELIDIRKEEGVLGVSMQNLEKAKEQVVASIRDREAELYRLESELSHKIRELTQSIVSFSEKSSSLELLSKVEKRYRELSGKICPHKQQYKEAQQDVLEIEKKSQLLETSMNEAEMEANKYRILNDVFRLIRSFVFESFSEGLNNSLREYCQIQNNGSLSATIKATSETAKGEVREKVSIKAHNPTGGEEYSSCSVGEKRRLDLPIAFALQDFSAKRGLGIGMSLLDEMFEAVDEVGKQGIFSLLNSVASRSHTPSVFVVTHSESLKPMFSSFINVVKEDGVSSIQ